MQKFKILEMAYGYNASLHDTYKNDIDDPQIIKLFEKIISNFRPYSIWASISPNNKHIAYYQQAVRGYSDYESFIVDYETLEPVCTIEHYAMSWTKTYYPNKWKDAEKLYDFIDNSKVYPDPNSEGRIAIYATQHIGWLNDDEYLIQLEIPMHDLGKDDEWMNGYDKLIAYNVKEQSFRNLSAWTIINSKEDDLTGNIKFKYVPGPFEIPQITMASCDNDAGEYIRKTDKDPNYLLHAANNNICNYSASTYERLGYIEELYDLCWQPRIPVHDADQSLFYAINGFMMHINDENIPQKCIEQFESFVNPPNEIVMSSEMIAEIKNIYNLFKLVKDREYQNCIQNHFSKVREEDAKRYEEYLKNKQSK